MTRTARVFATDLVRAIHITTKKSRLTLEYRLCVSADESYAEYLNFACNLPVENKRSDLT